MHGKVDANQPEIVDAFRRVGCTAAITSDVGAGFPDLVIGGVFPCPHCRASVKQNLLVEVKSENGSLTPAQKDFHLLWRGQLAIVRTVDDVLGLANKSRSNPQTGNKLINLNIRPVSVKVKADAQAVKDLRRELERIIAKYEKLILA